MVNLLLPCLCKGLTVPYTLYGRGSREPVVECRGFMSTLKLIIQSQLSSVEIICKIFKGILDHPQKVKKTCHG